MKIEDLLTLIFERFTGFQMLWSFYIAVAVGLLAYVGATASTTSSSFIRFILIISFAMFAFVNLSALNSVRDQRDGLAKIAKDRLSDQSSDGNELSQGEREKLSKVIEAGEPYSKCEITVFHLASDFLVILVIWFVPGILVSLQKMFAPLKNEKILPDGSDCNSVVVSRHEKRRVWILEEEYVLKTNDYHFQIPMGFQFDLASIPRSLWWLIAPFELSIAAPLIHDYLYATGGCPEQGLKDAYDKDVQGGLTRRQIDDVFFEIMRREHVWWWRRHISYWGVRIAGELFWRGKLTDI